MRNAMKHLVDKYFSQIAIQFTDYSIIDNATHDAANLVLEIPLKMCYEYSRLMGKGSIMPRDGARFWKDTALGSRLKESEKRIEYEHANLNDILEYLEGNVIVEMKRYRSIVEMDVMEEPEMVQD